MADIFFGASEAEAVGAGVSRAHPKKWLNTEKTSQIRVCIAQHSKKEKCLSAFSFLRQCSVSGAQYNGVRKIKRNFDKNYCKCIIYVL